jgi:cytidine deaminase
MFRSYRIPTHGYDRHTEKRQLTSGAASSSLVHDPNSPEGPAREVQELTAEDRDLIAAAERVIAEHGDRETHTVGAAVHDDHGGLHVGVNLYHFTGGPCAELVALAAARAAGVRVPNTIVAVGDAGRGVPSPCGRDRQVFADYYADLRVIVPTPAELVVVRAVDLLPYGYDWSAQQS